jgi:hypothetical protein
VFSLRKWSNPQIRKSSLSLPLYNLQRANDDLVHSFVYLGIPQFVLDWRPSVPGPKMGAFLTVSLSLTGLYIYDRKETARIQKEYCDKVRWMSEQNLDTHDKARKIRVYGARVPEDGELERGAKWFKRYMRVRSSFLCLLRRKEPFFSFFPCFSLRARRAKSGLDESPLP